MGRADARRVADLDPVAGPPPDAVEHGDRLVEVEVEDPGPEGVAPGVGQRPDHSDGAQRWSRGSSAAAGRPRCGAAPPTAVRPARAAARWAGSASTSLARSSSTYGWSSRPIRTLAARIRRTEASSTSSSTRPASIASGRCAYAGSPIAISMSTPALTARAPASVRLGREAVRAQVVHGLGVADDEAVEAPGPAQHLGQQPVVSGGRYAVEVHVGGHDVPGAGFDGRLERGQVDVPQLGVGQVDLVVVAPAQRGAVPGEVLRPGDDPAGRPEDRHPGSRAPGRLRPRRPGTGPRRRPRRSGPSAGHARCRPSARTPSGCRPPAPRGRRRPGPARCCPGPTTRPWRSAPGRSCAGRGSRRIRTGRRMPCRLPSTASRCSRFTSAGSVTKSSDPTSPLASAASTIAAWSETAPGAVPASSDAASSDAASSDAASSDAASSDGGRWK